MCMRACIPSRMHFMLLVRTTFCKIPILINPIKTQICQFVYSQNLPYEMFILKQSERRFTIAGTVEIKSILELQSGSIAKEMTANTYILFKIPMKSRPSSKNLLYCVLSVLLNSLSDI